MSRASHCHSSLLKTRLGSFEGLSHAAGRRSFLDDSRDGHFWLRIFAWKQLLGLLKLLPPLGCKLFAGA